MPKKARIRKTVRVRSDGKVVNTWNWPSCGVIVIYGPAAAAVLLLVEATRGIWS